MKKPLTNWLKKIFSDSHSAITSIVICSFFAGGTGLYLYAKNLWNILINIAQTPTPLWATISLALLLGLYIYLHIKRNFLRQCSYNPPRPPFEENKDKEKYQFRDNLLWLDNDPSPFCPVCYEKNNKKIHMLFHKDNDMQEEWEFYECHTCEYRTKTITSEIFVPF